MPGLQSGDSVQKNKGEEYMYIVAVIAFILAIALFIIGMFFTYENEVKKTMIQAAIILTVIAAVASCCYMIFQN